VELILWQENKSYPYLQIYIPPGRECIALEPMSHPTNVFNSHPLDTVLKPGQVWKGKFGVYLK